MTLTTYEGIVEKGKIRLKTGNPIDRECQSLCERSRSTEREKKVVRIRTSRLANRKKAGEFKFKMKAGKA